MNYNVVYFFIIKIKMIFFSNIIKKILNCIYPNKCVGCDMIFVDDFQKICEKCWQNIKIISDPICQKCGKSIKFEQKNNEICINCLISDQKFDKSRSVCVYFGLARKMVLSMKNHDNHIVCKIIADFMIKKFSKELEICDLVCCVPMHKKKLLKRMYNQSALILKNMKKINPKINAQYMFLEKVKNTENQIKLNQEKRNKNLKNSIKVRFNKECNFKKIAIIDDVMTTGSTFSESSRAIKKIYPDCEVFCFSFCSTELQR